MIFADRGGLEDDDYDVEFVILDDYNKVQGKTENRIMLNPFSYISPGICWTC